MEHEQQQEEEEEQENPDGKREERSQSKPAMDLKQLKSQLAVTRSNNNNESSTRSCLSLPPLGSNETELCTLGGGVVVGSGSRIGGMECLPPGPYHYHVTDQAKSLQELQNEVGALLEFRDLVIETFPDLKNKMASSGACSTVSGIPTSSLAARRAEWEPGIRVRRKLMQKESEISPTSLSRSRSNSHSGKKEPKSGESVVIQDSGFSTETSSSKEAHSASSTSNGTSTTTTTAGAGGALLTASSSSSRLEGSAITLVGGDSTDQHSNELWNLLDVIHRKSTRLRDELEGHSSSSSSSRRALGSAEKGNQLQLHFQKQLSRLSKDDVQILRKERDRLLERLSDMETETITGRMKIASMQDEISGLSVSKRQLEDRLKGVLSQSRELNNGIRDLHAQHVSSSNGGRMAAVVGKADSGDNNNTVNCSKSANCDGLGRLDGVVSSPHRVNKVRLVDSKKIASILLETNFVELQRHLLTLTVQNQVLQQKLDQATRSKIQMIKRMAKAQEDMDDLKFQLEEKNIEFEGTRAQLRVLESKSHLRSDAATRSCSSLVDSQEEELGSSSSPRLGVNRVANNSMRAMVPLLMTDDVQLQHSSSTESAHDHTEQQRLQQHDSTPKKRIPSRIPLPGAAAVSSTVKTPTKPPTGRKASAGNITSSGPPSSNKSLNQNRQISSSSTSLNRRETSLTRPDSAHSWRNSYQTPLATTPAKVELPSSSSNNNTPSPYRNSSASGSSIPISTTASVNSVGSSKGHLSTSPVKNSSLKSTRPRQSHETNGNNLRARNLMDSLTGPSQQVKSPGNSMSSKMSSTNSSTTPVTMILNNNNNSSSGNGKMTLSGNRMVKASAVPVRRASSRTSIGSGDQRLDQSGEANENGKELLPRKDNSPPRDYVNNRLIGKDSVEYWRAEVQQPRNPKIDSDAGNRDLIKEYFARTRAHQEPPAIFSSNNNQINVNGYFPTQTAATDDDMDLEQVLNFVDENFKEICVSSVIVPEKKSKSKTSTFHATPVKVRRNSESCHLIGRVNPNILRTWEQLNQNHDREEEEEEDEGKRELSFDGYNFRDEHGELASFKVNYVTYDRVKKGWGRRKAASSDDLFYDSIDEEEDRHSSEVSRAHALTSLSSETTRESIIYRGAEKAQPPSLMTDTCADQYLIGSSPIGGEGMAECDSLDKKRIKCWSLDNEGEF